MISKESKSRGWFLLVGAAALFSASLVSAWFARPTRPELLTAERGIVDLGFMSQGETRSASFRLTNDCRKTVYISRVINSCTCTTTRLTKTELLPGEFVDLQVSLRSGKSRGPVQSECSVLYFQEDTNRLQSLRLHLKATCEPDIQIEPAKLKFKRSEPSEKQVVLSPGRMPIFSVSRVYCDRVGFSAVVSPDEGADGETTVQVTFDPLRWTGNPGTAHLFLETDSRREPVMSVDLTVLGDNESAPMQ